MKKILLLLWIGIAAQAANYYVDAAGGDNAYPGTSPDAPWKDLWKVSEQVFGPGDRIFLKRGSVWTNDKLLLTGAGADGQPIVLDAYGEGSVKPRIDGKGYSGFVEMDSFTANGLINVAAPFLNIANVEVVNSAQNGIKIVASDVVISDSVLSGNFWNGIETFNASRITIRNSQIFNNAIDTTRNLAGIHLNGNRQLQTFLIEGCDIHHNTGGGGVQFLAGNGIMIGNTGVPPSITGLVISGNDIHHNGNPVQNQHGRGITANVAVSVASEMKILKNRIYENASAGVYIGDLGQTINSEIKGNHFRNNQLRQFGGYTQGTAQCEDNTMLVDRQGITANGAEVGGAGTWYLRRNTFLYMAVEANDNFRAYIVLNNANTNYVGESNVFFSVPGNPERWKIVDRVYAPFFNWQSQGKDVQAPPVPPQGGAQPSRSVNPRP